MYTSSELNIGPAHYLKWHGPHLEICQSLFLPFPLFKMEEDDGVEEEERGLMGYMHHWLPHFIFVPLFLFIARVWEKEKELLGITTSVGIMDRPALTRSQQTLSCAVWLLLKHFHCGLYKQTHPLH